MNEKVVATKSHKQVSYYYTGTMHSMKSYYYAIIVPPKNQYILEVFNMETALQVKEVNFNGDILLAAQDNENKIYVAVNWVCRGIGLSDGQMKNERKKIQSDLILSRGGRNLILPTNGSDQETVCLRIDFLPLWLAKISITPAMKQNNPELVEKLVQYQLKAKDVLAAAFLPEEFQPDTSTVFSILRNLNENNRLMVGEIYRVDRRVDAVAQSNSDGMVTIGREVEYIKNVLHPKATAFDVFIGADDCISLNKVAKSIGIGRNKMMRNLRNSKILFKEGLDNIPYQRYVDNGYFRVKQTLLQDGMVHTVTKVTPRGAEYIRKHISKETEAEA